MSDQFLGEIRMASFSFPPKGWALCDGQLMQINQNQALFSLLGTTFGGDGRVTFALPNLQGRVPMHVGNGHVLGEQGGEQGHTLSISEIPTHTHTAQAVNGAAATPSGGGAFLAVPSTAVGSIYSSAQPGVAMLPSGVSSVGGSQAHLNMQPFLTISFCVALSGIFPSQN